MAAVIAGDFTGELIRAGARAGDERWRFAAADGSVFAVEGPADQIEALALAQIDQIAANRSRAQTEYNDYRAPGRLKWKAPTAAERAAVSERAKLSFAARQREGRLK